MDEWGMGRGHSNSVAITTHYLRSFSHMASFCYALGMGGEAREKDGKEREGTEKEWGREKETENNPELKE